MNKRTEMDETFGKLNKLYLDIKAGRIALNRQQYNLLNEYLDGSYPPDEIEAMSDWWWNEFRILPGWQNIEREVNNG